MSEAPGTYETGGQATSRPIVILTDHFHYPPCHSVADPCPTRNYRDCGPYNMGCFCRHGVRLGPRPQMERELLDILTSIRLPEGHPFTYVTHYHGPEDCDEGGSHCDPESRVACYPSPAYGVYVCVHATSSPPVGRDFEVVESILRSVMQEAERYPPSREDDGDASGGSAATQQAG